MTVEYTAGGLYKWSEDDKKKDTIEQMALNAEKIDAQLADKAEQTYVDTELAKKVTKPGMYATNCVGGNYVGTTTAEMQALKRILTYNAPSDFAWTDHHLVGKIFTDGEGNFATNFDVSALAPTGKKYYVDVVNGNDSNDGLTSGTALRSVHIAAKKSDAVEVIVASGYYDDGQALNNWAIDKSISIKAAAGADVTLSTRRILTGLWTKTAGYTNVYQASRTLVERVFDAKQKDASGDYYELITKTTIVGVDTTQGSMYYSGGILYIHTVDSRVPDADIYVYLDLYNIQVTAAHTVYLENIKLEGGKYVVYANKTTGSPTILAKNCKFKYAHFDDGCGHWGATCIYQNCETARNRNDGFSHNFYDSTPTKAIEINCISRNNGADGNNDNGSTSHDGCYVIRLNSAYVNNVGPNIGDVGGSQSWNMSCVVGESKGTSDAGKRGVTSSSNNGITGNKIWLDNCIIFGNTHDIYADPDNFIYIRHTKYGTTNDAQSVY